MKENNRLKVMFVWLFISIVINLGLLAMLVAYSISIRQAKQEIKTLKEKIWVLQTQIDSLKPYKPVYSEKQLSIIKTIVGNPEISKLIKAKPVLGGTWGCWSEHNIKFITDDKLLVLYDD
ncbi:MAG: hypothetical protein N2748_05090, partial [candidate division WOR-3 bacterium]|nr:hypothetical protein [candidate division WOR-3 bacterium]